jgi:serine/threonine-protein kinase
VNEQATDSDIEPPRELVADKYRLTRLLGRGGMGAVWEGVHITLGTRVAVKFIDSEVSESGEFRRRFDNEAKATAQLNSKYAVKVFDQGITSDGRAYIVMEFLSGESLEQRLSREGKLSLNRVATVIRQVSRALTRAHRTGIVHRDLKPDNIFVVHDEEDHTEIAKVVDFGIAKFTSQSDVSTSQTRTGAVLGTPQFMSPEQARGAEIRGPPQRCLVARRHRLPRGHRRAPLPRGSSGRLARKDLYRHSAAAEFVESTVESRIRRVH